MFSFLQIYYVSYTTLLKAFGALKPLFIRFTVYVFREHLSMFMYVLPSLLILKFDVGFDCINSMIIAFLFTLSMAF